MDPSQQQQVPYQPRRSKSRPNRALPSVPPPEEDVEAINAFEEAQAFTSPPSPPPSQNAFFDAFTSNNSEQHHEYDQGIQDESNSNPLTLSGATNDSASVTAHKRVRPPVPKTPTSFVSSPPGGIQAAGAQKSASHLNPYHSTLPEGVVPPTILTPLRAHYLKKSLVNKQISFELNLITHPVLGADALGLLGDPFVLSEKAKSEAITVGASRGDLPFMRYLFHQFFLPFPFLATAPPTFWSAKVQPFLSSFLSTTGVAAHSTLSEVEREIAESLMTKEEKKENEDRKKIWAKIEKHLALMVGVGIKLVGGEEVVRIGQAELRRLEALQEERRQKWLQRHPQGPGVEQAQAISFDVNVVGVRVVTERGRVRSKTHEEFIIRTSRTGVKDVFVSRRYGDFRRLAEELRLAFPDYNLPNPPPKDKTAAAAPVVQPHTTYSYYNPLRAIYGSGAPPSQSSSPKPGSSPSLSSPRASDELQSSSGQTTPLSREKNRLTLRAYIQNIISQPYVGDSPILRSFLLSNPTTLTPPEAADITRRLEADAVREEGRKRFRQEAERRVEALREGLAKFRGDVLAKEGGLKAVFEVVKRVERVEDLPDAEKSVLEWGKISLAATIFQLYVASDTASETLAGLKRLHGLMPYFVLKGILKISNPMAMIRGVLDLFLARPFGGQSLLQRMFSTSLNEDVRLLVEDIQVVSDKIDDPVLCAKVAQYVEAPFEIQEIYRHDAVNENVDLLVVILRSPDTPVLSRPQLQRVARASRAYREYKLQQQEMDDSDDDEGPDNEDAWLFEDLSILMKLMMRKKEKEALLALIFEGTTAELLKDIITIFYAPLAQVYKAASIADSLGDLQNFLNDMIRTVEAVEELSQEDPGRTVQTFIDLVERHEQSFYSFVHNVHSKGHGLFDALMSWIELFLSYARDGLPSKLDLEVLLPHTGPEREQIMREVDLVAQYHYRLKVAHEEKVRRRFAATRVAGPGGNLTSEQQLQMEEEQLVSSVMASLSIGDTAVNDAGEIADEEEDEEDDEDEDEDEEGEDDVEEEDFVKENAKDQMIESKSVSEHPSAEGIIATDTKGSTGRRESNSSNHRSSIEKIRSSLDLKRRLSPNNSNPNLRSDSGASPPPVPPKDTHLQRRQPGSGRHHGHSHDHGRAQQNGGPAVEKNNKKKSGKKKKRIEEMMIPPETKAIDELRPLFVEIVRPLLVVKPLKP